MKGTKQETAGKILDGFKYLLRLETGEDVSNEPMPKMRALIESIVGELCHNCEHDFSSHEYTEGVSNGVRTVFVDGEPLGVIEIVSLLNTYEGLLLERQRVVDAIPECKVHGKGCVTNALEWIEKKKHGVK